MKKEEMAKLEGYLRRTFGNKGLSVRPRAKITDSCEVYLGDDFVATITVDDEDGEKAYQFQMAILEIDLEDA